MTKEIEKDEAIPKEKVIVSAEDFVKMIQESESEECECGECSCGDSKPDWHDDVFMCELEKVPKYNQKSFQAGIDSVSEMCGKITAFGNIGLSPTEASELIMGMLMMEREIQAMEISAKTSIEVAKFGSIAVEKREI